MQPLSLSPHADYILMPPSLLLSPCGPEEKTLLCCTMQLQLGFPYELDGECSHWLALQRKQGKSERSNRRREKKMTLGEKEQRGSSKGRRDCSIMHKYHLFRKYNCDIDIMAIRRQKKETSCSLYFFQLYY